MVALRLTRLESENSSRTLTKTIIARPSTQLLYRVPGPEDLFAETVLQRPPRSCKKRVIAEYAGRLTGAVVRKFELDAPSGSQAARRTIQV